MSVKVGDRVELPVHWDRWMMGDRFGDVVKVARLVHVRLDRSGKTIRITKATAQDRLVDMGAALCPDCLRDLDRFGGNPDCPTCAAEPGP